MTQPSPTVTIRKAEEKDYPFILKLNKENVEVLAPMNEAIIRNFAEIAELFLVAEVDGIPAAFLIALREGQTYGSENYRWFSAHYAHFLYVDRIVIDASFRKAGLGRALYAAVREHAEIIGSPLVCAEIDTEPVYNEASLRFHAAMGFREVGTQYVRNGAVRVSLQVLELRRE